MVSAETQSILQRKAAIGKQEHEARAMSVAKAVRQSVAKLGNELFEMPLSVIGIVTEERSAEKLSDIVDETALLALLEGDGGRVGAAIIGPQIVGGLIQQQTIGKVSEAIDSERKMTQTDAAMCAPLLDALFNRVGLLVEDASQRRMIDGYKFGAQFDDQRALKIALDENDYYVIRLTVEMAGGVRQGDICIILPKSLPPAMLESDDPEITKNADLAANQMTDIAMTLPAELNMVLCKLSLGLAQVDKLVVGEIIKLPHNTFPETEIQTSAGNVIGTGMLGQVDGIRALRLRREPVYATQPRRRQSDLADLDLPDIETLPDKRKSKPLVSENSMMEEFVVDTGADLPELNENQNDFDDDEDALDPQSSSLPDLAETVGKGDTLDLPELDDLPDLADMPELANIS